MKNLTQKHIIIIVSVIVFILILWYFYSKGKDAGLNPAAVKVPADIVGAEMTDERKAQLQNLAINLFNDMDGWNVGGWESELYAKVSLLSNNELVAFNNIYNHLYQAETGESFLQWLRNENFSAYSIQLQAEVDVIINRLVEQGAS